MRRLVILFAIGLLFFGLNTETYAEEVSAFDGGWSITVDTEQKIRDGAGTVSEGLVHWKDPSGYDYMFQDSWWGRDIDASSEGPLSSLGIISNSNPAPNKILLNLKDNTRAVDYALSYELNGSGSSSSILERMTVTNSEPDPITLFIFKYADFDLCYGHDDHDNEFALGDTSGITQYDVFSTANVTPISSPAPNNYQISLCSGEGSIISSLNDNLPTTLTNGVSPFGSGDASFAFQWDFTLGAGQAYTFENMKTIITAPEPVSSVLFLIGGVSLVAVRSRRRNKMTG